jgi:hypothetical protein
VLPFDFPDRLRRCAADIAVFSSESLSEFFKIPIRHFAQTGQGTPIVFHPAGDSSAESHLLRGTIFWADNRQIVRGHPRISSTSDYTQDRFQVLQEPIMAEAATRGEVTAEPKLYGATIRVYRHGGDLYCASDVSHDGGNPLVGAGIDNSGGLGIDYGGQAARLLSQRYPRVERLARLGYTSVFVLQLPDLAPDLTVDFADMVLVDVIDPDHSFVDRLERERIAEDYGLRLVDLSARLTVTSPDSMALLRRCRAFEHQASTLGSAGMIVKATIDEIGDQLFFKVEPSSERDRTRTVSPGDLAAVTDEIHNQFGDLAWDDLYFVEELILEYLGTHHRTARWRVQEYLASWQAARRAAGLG